MPDLVQVAWFDAECTNNAGWEDPDVMFEWASEPPPLMYSVGYRIMDEDNFLVLLDTIGPNEVGTANKIPRGMISHITLLGSYT